jgi:hypothetical protein
MKHLWNRFMKIPPIHPTSDSKNPPQRRAQMSVRHKGRGVAEHTVTDSLTGEKFDLPPKAAWEKFNEINNLTVDEMA